MKSTIIILFALLCLNLTGQNIIPIPEDSTTQWRVVRKFMDGSCVNVHNSIYYVDGTVIHNGKEYYEIYETGEFSQEIGVPPGPCDDQYTYNDIYRGAIRSENGKTYSIHNGEEKLLLDFTLNVGDTLFTSICPGLIIGSIDSVLVGTEYRKRFNFSNGDVCHWMIEGMGHECGLFEPMYWPEKYAFWFICYGKDNSFLYGDPNCTLNVDVEEIASNVNKVKIYPNPVKRNLFLNIESDQQILHIEIFDLTGRRILELKDVYLMRLQLNTKDLKSGVYFYNISLVNDRIQGKLIVK